MESPPTQVLPPWYTLITSTATDAAGIPTSTLTTLMRLPLTYYGPSVRRSQCHTHQRSDFFFCMADTSGYRHEHLGLRGPNTAKHGKPTTCIAYGAKFTYRFSHPFLNLDDTPLFHFITDIIGLILTIVISDFFVVFDLHRVVVFHRVAADHLIDPIFGYFQFNPSRTHVYGRLIEA